MKDEDKIKSYSKLDKYRNITDVKKRSFALVEDTVTYYASDPKLRCIINNLYYRYSPTNTTSGTEGCAIGRLLPLEESEKLDERGILKLRSIVNNGRLLQPNLPELSDLITLFPNRVLFMLQDLHDNDINWSLKKGQEGLSKKGQSYLNLINRYITNLKTKQI